MTEDTIRPLPCSPDAERAVLSCALQWPECSDTVAATPEGDRIFYAPANRDVWVALRDMRADSRPVDITTLGEELSRRDQLDGAGGPAYLAELQTDIPTPAFLPEYLEIVRESARRRELITAAAETAASLYDPKNDIEAAAQALDASLRSIESGGSADNLVDLSAGLSETVALIEERYKAGGILPGISTGFPDLDARTNGLLPTDAWFIGARPGTGKTALAVNIAANVAKQGHHVAIFSAEMTREQLCLRLLSSESGIDGLRLRRGKLEKSDFAKMTQGINKSHALPITIDDRSGMRLTDIVSGTRKLVRDRGTKVVIVDYLQLLQEPDESKRRDREDAVRRLSNGLKNLAKETGVTMIAACQLNREVDKRKEGKPKLSDLRESGNIEQDANVVVLLHNLEPESEAQILNIDAVIAKARDGNPGIVDLEFDKPTTTFRERYKSAG